MLVEFNFFDQFKSLLNIFADQISMLIYKVIFPFVVFKYVFKAR